VEVDSKSLSCPACSQSPYSPVCQLPWLLYLGAENCHSSGTSQVFRVWVYAVLWHYRYDGNIAVRQT